MNPAIFQRFVLFGFLSGLSACGGNYLDVRPLETSIKTELEKQGGIIVQTVFCPKDMPKLKDNFFQCQGKLVPRGEFVVTVQQEDEAGKVKWEVLNSNGLLNLPRLEKRLQKEVGAEIGVEPTIKCGTGTRQYRATKPGDSFECKVTNGRLTSPQGQIDKLVVKVDRIGNVNWQQYRTIQAVAPGTLPAAIPGVTSVKPASTPSPSAAIAPPGKTGKTAEDALNQPGATDGFD
jgi:hypothetical protein